MLRFRREHPKRMTSADHAARQGQKERAGAITIETGKTRCEEADLHGGGGSLHRDGFGEVARLVDVGALVVRDAVRVQL